MCPFCITVLYITALIEIFRMYRNCLKDDICCSLVQYSSSNFIKVHLSVSKPVICVLRAEVCPRPSPSTLSILLLHVESLYLIGLPCLQLFVSLVHPWLSRTSIPDAATNLVYLEGETASSNGTMDFLPLMATSVYCSIGIIWAWLRLSYVYMRG